MDGWYDAEDFTPVTYFQAELSDGTLTQARYICGNWETAEGQAVYPVRFQATPTVIVTVGLYKSPFDLE